MSKNTLQSEFQLTQNQLQSFHREGFIGPFQAYSPEEMTVILDALPRLKDALDSAIKQEKQDKPV